MTIVLDDWLRVKKRVEEIQRLADKAQAEYDHALAEVKTHDRVRTLKAARLKLAKRTKLEIQVYKEWVRRYKAFKKKHKEVLDL